MTKEFICEPYVIARDKMASIEDAIIYLSKNPNATCVLLEEYKALVRTEQEESLKLKALGIEENEAYAAYFGLGE